MKKAYLYPMKGKYLLLAGTMLLLFAFIGSCKKEEVINDGSGNNNEPETSIEFRCMDDTIPLQGVLVGITPNQGDRDNGVFLRSGNTNSSGRVKFDNLIPLTYYYSATRSTPNGPVVRNGQLTIEEGDEVDRNINF